MRYWVYINDKVDGPYEEDKLVTLQDFTPDTLICAEEISAGGSQEWVKASSIFEFDQVEKTINQPLPAEEVFNTQTAHNEPLVSQQILSADNVNNLLLEKIEVLTREITGLQSKLDDMKNKLDAALLSAQYTQPSSSEDSSYVPPQDNPQHTITLTRQNLDEVNEEALITNTESLVSKAEDIVAAANQAEKPLDMLGPVDLGDKKPSDPSSTEVSLGSKAEEEVVLRSALDSLYNARTVEQTQEEKESTFQDLLTPQQAQALAAQAAANQKPEQTDKKPTLDEALETVQKQDEALAAQEKEKDALINELISEPKEDVLDQVIKERESEEQKGASLSLAETAAAAAAGAAAGFMTAEALKQEETKSEDEAQAPGFGTVEEAAAEPLPEKQTLDFSDETKEPALSIAPDRTEPEKLEEVKPAEQMPADVPTQPQPTAQEETNAPHLSVISSEEGNQTPAAAEEQEEKKEETLQELVPGAKTEKPEGVIITEADLNEAFRERNTESEQSVEQLFGVAGKAESQEEKKQDLPQEEPKLPQFSDQTTDKPLPMGNPNDLTEIELKEGSTYLISDFVPPAQASGNTIPEELAKATEGIKETAAAEKTSDEQKTETADIQEMVSSVSQTEKPLEKETDAPQDVTVSQIILENTIKTKRGATLDIKTVPMVPEPAQSERLNLEGLDDDLNTQHDIKSADAKPAAKMTKVVVGSLVAIVLAALIYTMLAFMNLIPPQFNLLSSNQAAQAAEQDAQLEEMLGTTESTTPVPTADNNTMMPAAANPMEATLQEVKNYPLLNGYTLEQFIVAKHPAAKDLITWDISTAVDPDNYSILVKVPPENPQSFKISYRFNYNTVTKALDPTISDAKNLLDSIAQGTAVMPQEPPQQQLNSSSQPAGMPVVQQQQNTRATMPQQPVVTTTTTTQY